MGNETDVKPVSILVLMDFRLKEFGRFAVVFMDFRFNPCSNGLSAQRKPPAQVPGDEPMVSILVLMDFRLKGTKKNSTQATTSCFNPCSNGLSAQSHRCQD